MQKQAWLVMGLLLLGSGMVAVSQQKPAPKAPPAKTDAAKDQDKQAAQDPQSAAYYHFSLGRLYERMYESQYESGGRSEYANLAIENYKKAYELDPKSDMIGERLAEMYAKSQRIRDAVLEAQEIIKRDPTNVGARRLLARIYIRTLGNAGPGAAQSETLKRAVEQLTEVVRLEPSDAESALWLARLHRIQNDHERAGQVLRGLLERQPRNEAALEQMSQLLIDQGRAPEAIAMLEKAAGGSASVGLLALQGDAYQQIENHAKAEEAYRKVLERDPRRNEARGKLARALAAQGKNEDAVREYQRLTESEPGDGENYLRLAQVYRAMGRLQPAEENIVKARERSPGSLEVIYNEALIYEAQGRFDDAIRSLSGAVASLKARRNVGGNQARRSLAIFYEQLGRLYREVENYTAAIATYNELLSLGPDELRQGRVLMVETYRAAKQLDQAIAESEKAMAAEPTDRGYQVAHALLLADKGQTDAAAERLRNLLAGTREDREIHLTMAQVFERGKRYPSAEKALDEAEKLSPRAGEKEVIWFLRAAVNERQKKFAQAEEFFRKTLELNPRNAGALNYYGYMLTEQNQRLEEAVELIKRALAEEAYNGAYLDSLGWAYFKLNRIDEAEETLRRALERNRHDPVLHDHLGDVYAKQGRNELAAAAWERSLTEWKRATPAEIEPEKIAATETKLKQLKNKLAQQKRPAATEQ